MCRLIYFMLSYVVLFILYCRCSGPNPPAPCAGIAAWGNRFPGITWLLFLGTIIPRIPLRTSPGGTSRLPPPHLVKVWRIIITSEFQISGCRGARRKRIMWTACNNYCACISHMSVWRNSLDTQWFQTIYIYIYTHILYIIYYILYVIYYILYIIYYILYIIYYILYIIYYNNITLL